MNILLYFLYSLYNYFFNFIFLIKFFYIENFQLNNYNFMKLNIFTFVSNKNNKFKENKFFLTNLPFNLKNTKEFQFTKDVHFTNNINHKAQNHILIINVSNLYKFTNDYFEYDIYDIFHTINLQKLKKDFGGIFFINQDFTRNIFKYKFMWFFTEKNFSGYLFNKKLINSEKE